MEAKEGEVTAKKEEEEEKEKEKEKKSNKKAVSAAVNATAKGTAAPGSRTDKHGLGIMSSHGYTVLEAVSVDDDRDGSQFRLLRLRDPWHLR